VPGVWVVEDELLVDGLLAEGLVADGLLADGLVDEELEGELLGAWLLGAGMVLPAGGVPDDELAGWSDDLGALLASDPGALDEAPGWVPDEDGAEVCAVTPSARARVSTRLSRTAVGLMVMGHLLLGTVQQCKCQHSHRSGAHLGALARRLGPPERIARVHDPAVR
jgi:hypothetical protein